MSILPRNRILYLVKSVPVRFASIEPRKQVWISLKTDSMDEALEKQGLVWRRMLEGWEAKLAGRNGDALKRYAAARSIAQARGLRYIPLDEVSDLPVDGLVERIEAVTDRNGKLDTAEIDAFFGLVDKPRVTTSEALTLYWDIAKGKTRGKSDDQQRRWRNPKIKAVRNFETVNGVIALEDITPDHMQAFYDWWFERMEDEGLTSNSANKDMSHIKVVFEAVDKARRLRLDMPLAGWKFPNDQAKVRPPFPDDFIKTKMLSVGALDGLNLEARCILLGMINTGYRPSEGACLGPDQIRLDTEIPHISIEPVGRQLKSAYSQRVIPLVGVSLQAFQQCPTGFARYADSAALSATVNKYLRAHDLTPTPDHTMYSLRHSFEDRMLAAEFDDRIRRDLFGHTLNRQRYGAGATLQHKFELLEGIAI